MHDDFHHTHVEHGRRVGDLATDAAACALMLTPQTAWSNYRSAVFAKQLANEQQMTAMMNQDAFDFGPWGPGFW